VLRSYEQPETRQPKPARGRLLAAGVWVGLFAIVLLATAWLATTAVVAALCWVAGREWLREHDRSQTTVA
jgi:hypothetical protein